MELSKLAIVSFTLTILAIISSLRVFLPPLNSYLGWSFFMIVISLILAIVSLVKIKRKNLKGKWFAIIALILDIIFIPIFALTGL